jgi:uncharacterized protein YkwD
MFGMLIISVVKPTVATQVVDQVLGTFTMTGAVEPIPKIISSIEQTAQDTKPLFSFFDNKKAPKIPLESAAIIEATNKERVKAGLAPLAANEKLTASAKLKVDDMIKLQYFEHRSPTGQNVSDLGDKVGYAYVVMGENLALGNFANATELVTAWMNSPGHRANILNGSYEEMGAYALKANYQGREVWFAVQHFGTTRNACPIINAELKARIDIANNDLKERDAVLKIMRSKIEAPNHPTGEEYSIMINTFNRLVKEYNAKLAESQKLITQYNAQVVAFNKCLAAYQKPE